MIQVIAVREVLKVVEHHCTQVSLSLITITSQTIVCCIKGDYLKKAQVVALMKAVLKVVMLPPKVFRLLPSTA